MRWPSQKKSSESFNISEGVISKISGIVNEVRQNHALEHATIAILVKQLEGKVRMAGRAGYNCFYLYGNVPTESVEKAATEALRRLQGGEEELAVSAMCGTNLVVTGLAAGVASILAGSGQKGWTKFSRVVQASTIAALLAQPLGRMAQKHVTTTPDVDSVNTVIVSRKGSGRFTCHKVSVIR